MHQYLISYLAPPSSQATPTELGLVCVAVTTDSATSTMCLRNCMFEYLLTIVTILLFFPFSNNASYLGGICPIGHLLQCQILAQLGALLSVENEYQYNS